MAGDHGRQLQLSILGDTGTCKSATHSWQVARVNSYDVFHTWHLGVGKYWTASILALLSFAEAGSNIDARFESLTAKYLSFCKRTSISPILTKVTKETLQWPSTNDWPKGSWYKGGVTTAG